MGAAYRSMMETLTRSIEAILFLAPRPVPLPELAAACRVDEGAAATAVQALEEEYAPGRHGLELRHVAGGLQVVVAADCEASVVAYGGGRAPDDLSPALLETLTVVAYLQPSTRAEVARVRGVSSEWALTALEERGLVEERGRADAPGAPILYGTTERFLLLFGLRQLDELPALEGFAPGVDDVEELRARLLANAERRIT
jgi:segregation and condensation protein B